MWNKCHTSVSIQKMCRPAALSRKPEQMVWVSQAGWRAAWRWGEPPPSHTSPVSWVSAPGGQGHSLGGCWQGCSPDDISSQYWSFYSCSCGPAYSGELGLALCARACVFSGVGAWRGGERRDTETKVADGQQATGIRWSWLMRPAGSLGWTPCRYTAVPAYNILHLWPCLSLWNIWRAGTGLVLCGLDAARWPCLKWLGPV